MYICMCTGVGLLGATAINYEECEFMHVCASVHVCICVHESRSKAQLQQRESHGRDFLECMYIHMCAHVCMGGCVCACMYVYIGMYMCAV